jgi:hypothetical protein
MLGSHALDSLQAQTPQIATPQQRFARPERGIKALRGQRISRALSASR